ncbi:MAG: hypothetical protein RLZZ458_2811 [Planctomycetota bacterium]|jgi:hypothetical protein
MNFNRNLIRNPQKSLQLLNLNPAQFFTKPDDTLGMVAKAVGAA